MPTSLCGLTPLTCRGPGAPEGLTGHRARVCTLGRRGVFPAALGPSGLLTRGLILTPLQACLRQQPEATGGEGGGPPGASCETASIYYQVK